MILQLKDGSINNFRVLFFGERLDDLQVNLVRNVEGRAYPGSPTDPGRGAKSLVPTPLLLDDFESYSTGESVSRGGWTVSLARRDGGSEPAALLPDRGEKAGFAVDSIVPISGSASGLAVVPASAILTLSKPVSWPDRAPFAVSAGPFAIVPSMQKENNPEHKVGVRDRLRTAAQERTCLDESERQPRGPYAGTVPSPVPTVTRSTVYTPTYYIHSYDGRLLAEYDATGTCVKDYIYLGNKLLAEYYPATGKYYYYTSDQINSTRIITDSYGTVVYSAVFDPYGGMQKQWVNAYQPSLKFSGKERESQSELDYFGARYYDHLKYRFISVDPLINKEKAFSNPQYWNLYSYCGNNPITFLDLDGRDWLEFTGLKLNWYGGNYGNKSSMKMSINAVSGKKGFQHPDAQHIHDKGPVPEGKYSLNLSNTGLAKTTAEGDYLASGNGIQSIPEDFVRPWGKFRIRMTPKEIDENYINRDNFYLHTSDKGETSGCIETKGNNSIISGLMDSGLNKIEMRVDYTDWRKN